MFNVPLKQTIPTIKIPTTIKHKPIHLKIKQTLLWFTSQSFPLTRFATRGASNVQAKPRVVKISEIIIASLNKKSKIETFNSIKTLPNFL